MKQITILTILVVLFSCASGLPESKWGISDNNGKFVFEITSNEKCYVLSTGKIDGVGFECIYKKIASNRYFIYPIERNGDINRKEYFEFEYLNNGTTIKIGQGKQMIELNKIANETNQ